MASNLIFRIASEYSSKGTDDASKGLEQVKKQMQETASGAKQVSSSFQDMARVVSGAILTLPFATFVKEAIRSEEITARFGLQLRTLGKDFDSIDIERLSKQVRDLAGITQTELIQGLSAGVRYFKDTEKELALLNTAIGMTKVSGVSLATAFQQLGYIQLGYARIARQYGVSMHSEIHDPTQKAAAIIRDLTKAMEPLAKQTGTAAEALKIAGASIKDIGEKLGSTLLTPIAKIADVFNKLPDNAKEIIVVFALLTTTVTGLSLAFISLSAAIGKVALGSVISDLAILSTMAIKLKELPIVIGLIANTLSRLAVPLVVLAGIATIITSYQKLAEAQKRAKGIEESYTKFAKTAMEARASDATKTIGLEESFVDKLKEVIDVRNKLAFQEAQFNKVGNTVRAERAKQEKEAVQSTINAMREEISEMAKHNITNLQQYKQFQFTMAGLRNAAMKEGLEKDLDAFRIKMQKERDEMFTKYGQEMDVRKALAEKEAVEEQAIFKKAIDSELDFALKSKEEQKKFTKDYEKAISALEGTHIEDLKYASDATKTLIKDTEGGKKALDEWTQAEARRQQKIKELTTLSDKEKESLGLAPGGGLKTFAQLEKTANIDLTAQVNVSITPNLSEVKTTVGDAVVEKLGGFVDTITREVKKRLVA